MRRLLDSWWGDKGAIGWLIPLSWLYLIIIRCRRWAYRMGLLSSCSLDVPVLVVGNITLGGTGKTPLVIWLANQLTQRGFKPGIISRGYGGKAKNWPQWVTEDSNPVEVGDEPVMIARRTQCPVVVGADRIADARLLLESRACDMIISDDGLQHYRLQRDIEIAVVDGIRGFGNGWVLPAGPLREPVQRLKDVDYILINGKGRASCEGLEGFSAKCFSLSLIQGKAINLLDDRQQELSEFKGADGVHGVAGIGNPDRFFEQLKDQGLQVESHGFPDHYAYNKEDMDFNDQKNVLMTEKDGVKYRLFADSRHWMVPVSVDLDENLITRILEKLGLGRV